MIFQIVNPDRLWIEALTFDAVAGARSATARLNDGRSLKLDYQGTGLPTATRRSRSISRSPRARRDCAWAS